LHWILASSISRISFFLFSALRFSWNVIVSFHWHLQASFILIPLMHWTILHFQCFNNF